MRAISVDAKNATRKTQLAPPAESARIAPMNFALAILAFFLFAFFIGWGIVLLLAGKPILFAVAMLVFVGTFIKYGCLSH